MEYTIRFAEINDIPAIMGYINDYWKKGHVLATDRSLFEWQYVNNKRVNFVLGIGENNSIQGILGYIPYGSDSKKDIALALWKANQSAAFLGIRLIMFLKEEETYRNIICPGINMQTTSKIYTQLGMKVDVMRQWYRLRKDADYTIGLIENKAIPEAVESKLRLQMLSNPKELESFFDFSVQGCMITPYKSREYFIRRYFEHPRYAYLVYGVFGDDRSQAEALLVLRIQEYNGSKVFRFVDYIGEQSVLPYATKGLDLEMVSHQVEYVDMYESGLEDEVLYAGGWLPVKNSNNIIPNYFSPYEQRLVEIYYSSSCAHTILFRGDGDQDRPN